MSSSDVERRFTAGQVETRAAADNKRTIGGYAAKFENQSKNLGGFVEIIRASAFNKSRGDGWPSVRARYQHEDTQLIGTTASGTLRLNIDDVGLGYEVDVPHNAALVYELIQRGDIRESSFAFSVPPGGEEWGLNDLDIPLRTLNSVRLIDVAPVTEGAYPDTTAGLRAEVAPALRSLSVKMNAPFEDVRKLAAMNELRRFFKRTDGSDKRPDFGAAARMALLGRKSDPWA